LSKIFIFEQNFDFGAQLRFLSKITIFEKNYDFCAKFRFLSKISISEQNLDFFQKFLQKPEKIRCHVIGVAQAKPIRFEKPKAKTII